MIFNGSLIPEPQHILPLLEIYSRRMKKLLLTQLFEAWETRKSKLQAGAQSNVERTEQLNLRTLACVQWDECFITIMYIYIDTTYLCPVG